MDGRHDGMKGGVALLLAGLPGAGKTTVSDAVSRETGAVVIGRDIVRRGVFPVCTYTDAEKEFEARVVLESLAINVALRRDVIADGISFGEPGLLERARESIEDQGGVCLAVWLQASVKVASERVELDRVAGLHEAADRDRALVYRVHETFRQMPTWVDRVNADRPVDDVIEEVLRLFVRGQSD